LQAYSDDKWSLSLAWRQKHWLENSRGKVNSENGFLETWNAIKRGNSGSEDYKANDTCLPRRIKITREDLGFNSRFDPKFIYLMSVILYDKEYKD
jgi:hypothetical protein